MPRRSLRNRVIAASHEYIVVRCKLRSRRKADVTAAGKEPHRGASTYRGSPVRGVVRAAPGCVPARSPGPGSDRRRVAGPLQGGGGLSLVCGCGSSCLCLNPGQEERAPLANCKPVEGQDGGKNTSLSGYLHDFTEAPDQESAPPLGIKPFGGSVVGGPATVWTRAEGVCC